MRSFKVIAVMIGLFFTISCASVRPISTELPNNASKEHLYLAVLEDYAILSKDVNSLIQSPSISKKNAEQIDKVMDKADAEIANVEELRKSGQPIEYQVVIEAMNVAIQVVCDKYGSEVPSCGGR